MAKFSVKYVNTKSETLHILLGNCAMSAIADNPFLRYNLAQFLDKNVDTMSKN